MNDPAGRSFWSSAPEQIGWSVENRPIESVYFGRREPQAVIVLATIHGDEPKAKYVADQLVETVTHIGPEATDNPLCIVPLVNPDGYARRRRKNARGVDLNRNFPTANWEPSNPRRRYYGGPAPASEPEAQALIELIDRLDPIRVISIHAISKGLECNNFDGPAADLAERMARHNGYPVQPHIGYPTPGSFGTWIGIDRGIPSVTLELPTRTSRQRDWKTNREALLDVIAR